MRIEVQRTRIIFTLYTDEEQRHIEDLAATEDKAFIYEDKDNRVIAMPTGMLPYVKRAFTAQAIIDNSKNSWPAAKIQAGEPSCEPRNAMQIDFIKFALKCFDSEDKIGGILPPGAGKTFMTCYIAIKAGLRTLIVAPTTSVKAQWGETLTGMFSIDPARVTVVQSPRDFVHATGDFVITTQASLAVLNKTYDLQKVLERLQFGFKAIDETHMFFHNTVKLDGSANIKQNLYLTGTFGRSGTEENELFHKMFGDIKIFDVPDKKPTLFDRRPGDIYGQKPHMHVKMLWAHSGISPEDKKACSKSVRYSERAGKWRRYGLSVTAYTSVVIPSDGRLTKFLQTILDVIKMANNEVTYGKMLVLVPTIASVEIVLGHVKEIYPNLKIGSIHSHNKKAQNDQNKAECDIMISTVKSAGTGFDVKDLSKLVVAEQYKSWILADQVSGRLRRRPDGKDTYMWDIVDADVNQLKSWANSRSDVFQRKAKTFKVMDIK